ncbi:MAG: DUF2339 domain-containing protein, partial [Proteobacteria bacterium]|nr:DUF2339 domain-containing protein [Pseudomonadota bacterium]
MEWVLAIFFGIAFAMAGDEAFLQFAVGAVLGFLLARVIALNSRIRFLEDARKVEQAQRRAIENTQRRAADVRDGREATPERDSSAALDEARQLEPKAATPLNEPRAPSGSPAESSTSPTPPQRSAAAAIPQAATRTEARPRPARASQPASEPAPDWRDIPVMRWLLKGNIPVKVGVLVSFFGVAFLLKHAVDEGWMSMPIEFRLAGVAAFGIGLLWFGWRLKESHRIYALSIQGGGIGVLYLTTYTALRLFHVLPAGAAFTILVALAIGAGWLAIKQNARQLAVLGAVGGFIAPLLASTGTGSHVALFGYYLVLNLGIAGVALYRHWRMLNLLGFVFTFGIGLAWGAQYYQPRYFATVEPFLRS